MLKKKLSQESFDGLSEALKGFYSKRGDNYFLELEDDDSTALLNAKEHEKARRKEAETKLQEAERRLSELADVDHRKRGDVEALELSWKGKLEAVENEYKGRLEGMMNSQRKTLLDSTSSSIAERIAKVPSLMKKALSERLTVEFGENGPQLRVLDSEGKPSAMSVQDLEKEFLANKEFAPILIASKASGSGGRDASNPASGQRTETKSMVGMNPTELAAIIAAKKGE